MSLDRLLFEVTAHYRNRGFEESPLRHLRWTLLSNVNLETGRLCLKTAYPGCDKEVNQLLGRFKIPEKVEKATEEEIKSADAVFGFAFGYQMEAWLDGTKPTDTLEVRLRRRPGKNNIALATIADDICKKYGLPLYLQFEIAEAASVTVAFSSTPVDQGTFAVAKEFMAYAEKGSKTIKKVALLAHGHHYERCQIVLERLGVQSIAPNEPYFGYDEQEAQPRTMSPEEYIVNDFASMAGMLAG